jgi:hypothetical protein
MQSSMAPPNHHLCSRPLRWLEILQRLRSNMKTILAVIAVVSTSCTLTVSPDGGRRWALDGEQVARAAIIISEK